MEQSSTCDFGGRDRQPANSVCEYKSKLFTSYSHQRFARDCGPLTTRGFSPPILALSHPVRAVACSKQGVRLDGTPLPSIRTPMKLLKTWFSYRGQLRPFDFVVRGLAPGIMLGVGAVLLEDAFNAHGAVIFPFLAFSLWPASAMISKVVASRGRESNGAQPACFVPRNSV